MEWLRISPQRYHELFMAYTASFDPCAVIEAHASRGLKSRVGRLTNFLGTVVDPMYFGDVLHGKAGAIEGLPIPGSWHACVAEWGACLRALDLARESFTIVELGCGWGCWLNNMAVAARNAGLTYELIGVEGDQDHLDFAKKTLQENGVEPDHVTLFGGVAAAGEGAALFPRQKRKSSSWGLEPVFNATEAQRRAARESGSHDELPMIPLERVIGSRPRVDLLHIDIQGGELALVANSLPILAEKVAYMFVATHSSSIEKKIHRVLREGPWITEIERPAIYRMQITGPRLKIDGVMGWRNTRLLPL